MYVYNVYNCVTMFYIELCIVYNVVLYFIFNVLTPSIPHDVIIISLKYFSYDQINSTINAAKKGTSE